MYPNIGKESKSLPKNQFSKIYFFVPDCVRFDILNFDYLIYSLRYVRLTTFGCIHTGWENYHDVNDINVYWFFIYLP